MSLNSAQADISVAQSLGDHVLHESGTITENNLHSASHHESLNVEESEQAQLLETLQNIVSLDASTMPQTTVSEHMNPDLLQVSTPMSHMSLSNLSTQAPLSPFSVSANNSIVSSWLNSNLMKIQSNTSPSSGILPPVTELHPALRAASNLQLLGLGQSSIVPCPTSIQSTTQNMSSAPGNESIPKIPISSTSPTFTTGNENSLPHVSVSKVKIPYVQQPLLQQSFPLNSLPSIPLTNNNQPYEMLSNNLVTSQSLEQDNLMNSLAATSSVTNLLSSSLMNNSSSLMKAFGLNIHDDQLSVAANLCNGGIFENFNNQPLPVGGSMNGTQFSKTNINSSNQPPPVTPPYFSNMSSRTLTLSTQTSFSNLTPAQPTNLPSNLPIDSSDESVFSSSVEETRCFKCKFCTFISLNKHLVISHVKSSHNKNSPTLQPLMTPNMNSSLESTNKILENDLDQHLLMQRENTTYLPTTQTSHISNVIDKRDVAKTSSSETESRFLCGKCRKGFCSLEACRHHMITDHSVKWRRIRLERVTGAQNFGMNKNNGNNNIITTTRSGTTLLELNSKGTTQVSKVINQKLSTKSNRKETETKLVITVKKQKGEISSRQKAWRKKLKREHGSYICEFKGCNVRFRQLDNLEYHCKCHINNCLAFICPECGNRFEHWGLLAGHLWRHHSVDLELHSCDQCSFRTYSLSKLENLHKRIHQDERPYLCDTCGKGFKTNKQLRNHKVIHTEKREQGQFRSGECPICHRRFSDKRMLRLHLDTVHNKIRPFLCNYCGYTASCKSTLKMHMRQHTGEKPFSCEICNYRTSDHNSLRRHKMRHSGEKPYKCPYCSYACIQSSTYKTHLKNKHPGQDDGLMFSCKLCSFRTIKHDTYITHMAGHKLDSSLQSTANTDATVSMSLHTVNGHATDLHSHGNSMLPLVESMDIGIVNSVDDNINASQFMFSALDDIGDRMVQEVVSKVS